jgi:hypothetical protein
MAALTSLTLAGFQNTDHPCLLQERFAQARSVKKPAKAGFGVQAAAYFTLR